MAVAVVAVARPMHKTPILRGLGFLAVLGVLGEVLMQLLREQTLAAVVVAVAFSLTLIDTHLPALTAS